MIIYGGCGAILAGNTVYCPIGNVPNTQAQDITDISNSERGSAFIPAVNIQFTNFTVLCEAPGVGQTTTFTLRIDAVDSAMAVVVSGAETGGSVSAPTVNMSANSLACVKIEGSGAAATIDFGFSFRVVEGS